MRRENTRLEYRPWDLYEINRRLHRGEHAPQVTPSWTRSLRNVSDEAANLVEITFNFHRRLTQLWVSLLLTKPPTFKANETAAQEWLDAQVAAGLVSEVSCIATDMSRFGDGLAKPDWDDELKAAALYSQSPFLGSGGWIPVVSPYNVRRVVAHIFAWVESVPVTRWGVGTTASMLHAEIHEPGLVRRQEWAVRTGKVLGSMVSEDVYRTGVDGLLVTQFPNSIASDDPWGTDDYGDIDSMVHEIETRLAQISRVLDTHADPKMRGPKHFLNTTVPTSTKEQQHTTPVVSVSGSKYFGMMPDDPDVEYIVWEAQLEQAFAEIDKLLELVYLVSETSPAAFGKIDQGLAESGSALKRLLLAPLLRATRMRNTVDERLKQALRNVAGLQAANGGASVDLTELTIEWKDGLPDDLTELVTTETQMVGAKLRSRKAAMQRVYGITDDEAKAELAEIDADAKKNAPAPPTAAFGLRPQPGDDAPDDGGE
jgi:hypothetical protein